MAAATRSLPVLIKVETTRLVPMEAVKLYKGWLVCLDDSANDYAAEATNTSGDKVVGIAMETVDNSSGAAGDTHIRVCTRGEVIIEGDATLAAIGGLGASCYATDGDTVANTGNNYAGYVKEFRNVVDPLSRSNAIIMAFGYDNRD